MGDWTRQVLVVEDEPFVRGLIAAVIEEAGLRAPPAADAAEALAAVEDADPDAAVLDIELASARAASNSRRHSPPRCRTSPSSFSRRRRLELGGGEQAHRHSDMPCATVVDRVADALPHDLDRYLR